MSSTAHAPKVHTYEEACAFIRDVGILPLSGFIPEHPSLDSITVPSSWHTGLDSDPWLWRDRFATEGAAAYGRFFKKKPVLVDASLFPLFARVLNRSVSLKERYDRGELSRSALHMYQVIRDQPGIDSRELRAVVRLKAKEDKREFDNALIELQSFGEVVICGITDRLNDLGTKNGWNSTCYMLSDAWLDKFDGLENVPVRLSPRAAKEELFDLLDERLSEAAVAYLTKALS